MNKSEAGTLIKSNEHNSDNFLKKHKVESRENPIENLNKKDNKIDHTNCRDHHRPQQQLPRWQKDRRLQWLHLNQQH